MCNAAGGTDALRACVGFRRENTAALTGAICAVECKPGRQTASVTKPLIDAAECFVDLAQFATDERHAGRGCNTIFVFVGVFERTEDEGPVLDQWTAA